MPSKGINILEIVSVVLRNVCGPGLVVGIELLLIIVLMCRVRLLSCPP